MGITKAVTTEATVHLEGCDNTGARTAENVFTFPLKQRVVDLPNGFVCSVDGVRPKIDNETLRKLKDLYIA